MMEKILYLTAGAVITYIYLKNKKDTHTLQSNDLNKMYDGNFDEDFFRDINNSIANKINNHQT